MIASITRATVIAALCLAIGLHWAVLQSVAWTTMLVGYASQTSLSEAVAKTFDGEHPCSLCRIVQKANGAEKKTALQPRATKVDLVIARSAPGFILPSTGFSYPSIYASVPERSQAPPNRPPRFLLG